MAKLDRLVWAASSTYHIGPYHLGVRTDSEWLDGVIRAALTAYHVPDVEAPANFSVVVPRSDERDAAKGLNMLYEAYSNLVRTRSPERVLQALFQHLAKHIPADTNGLVRMSYLALVRDGHSILVPRGIITWMDLLAPRLNRAGWQFVDHPWSLLDPEQAELVVPGPPLEIDDSWRDRVRTGRRGREPAPVEPGRYPLTGWGVYSPEERIMSPAAGVAAAAAGVLDAADLEVRDVLVRMLDLVQRVPMTGLGSPFEGDFASKLMAVDLS